MRFQGIVVDEHSRAVPGATVFIAPATGRYRSTKSDARGRFTFDGLERRSQGLIVGASAPGYARREWREAFAIPGECVLRLRRGARIAGRIAFAEPGTTERALVVASQSELTIATVYSRLDGTFEIENVPFGNVKLTMSVTNGGTAERTVAIREAVTQVLVTLTPSASVTCELTTATGGPLKNWHVRAVPVARDDRRESRGVTDRHGRCKLGSLRASASYSIMVRHSNLAEWQTCQRVVTATRAASGVVRVTVPRSVVFATAAVHGSVRDSRSRPLPGCVLVFRARSGSSYKTVTQHDGSYRLAGIVPGSYDVRVLREGQWADVARVQVEGGQERYIEVFAK